METPRSGTQPDGQPTMHADAWRPVTIKETSVFEFCY